jgi:multidrug efflux pump subunit AcrB
MEVRRQSGTNTVQVVDDILGKLDDINRTLPAGLKSTW